MGNALTRRMNARLGDNSGMTQLTWHPGFSTLGDAFFTRLQPTPLPSPYMVGASASAARMLGVSDEWLHLPETIAALSGNSLLEGSSPLATVYSGHQFGVWAGQLGDGRAIMLGEAHGDTSMPMEVQLKGSGRTPYSRGGDGRAVLRSSIREFLCSEAMHGLGIPTTRALCVTGSDQPIRREEVETAAVVTRLAPSFIRFGHFEHFASSGQTDELKKLADYVIDRYYPECRNATTLGGNPYANFLQCVSERTARLVAQWQSVGFCHGVMNTDNMSILGLTIDYGPFQFLDGFNPDHICNHSDTQGRYAYNKQPNVAYWNVFCLAQALFPLIEDQEVAIASLESYKTVFPEAFHQRMSDKLGLHAGHNDGDTDPDRDLVKETLELLAKEQTDFTIFWRRLSNYVAGNTTAEPVRDLFLDRAGFEQWLTAYDTRLGESRPQAGRKMLETNPKFVLRNHLGEEAIRKAKLRDYSGVESLMKVLSTPFDEHPDEENKAGFPPDWASSIEISCSS